MYFYSISRNQREGRREVVSMKKESKWFSFSIHLFYFFVGWAMELEWMFENPLRKKKELVK